MGNEPAQGSSQGVGVGHGSGSRATQFRPGMSGNPAGSVSPRIRLDRKLAELAKPYGGVGALAPDELELLRQAALLSTKRVGPIEQQVRVANALHKIFQLLADRHRGKSPNPLVADATKADVVDVALRQLGKGE